MFHSTHSPSINDQLFTCAQCSAHPSTAVHANCRSNSAALCSPLLACQSNSQTDIVLAARRCCSSFYCRQNVTKRATLTKTVCSVVYILAGMRLSNGRSNHCFCLPVSIIAYLWENCCFVRKLYTQWECDFLLVSKVLYLCSSWQVSHHACVER